MQTMQSPNTLIKDILSSTGSDAKLSPKGKTLTVGDLWRIRGFKKTGDPPHSTNGQLQLTQDDYNKIGDAFADHIRKDTTNGDPGWSYLPDMLGACCSCCT